MCIHQCRDEERIGQIDDGTIVDLADLAGCSRGKDSVVLNQNRPWPSFDSLSVGNSGSTDNGFFTLHDSSTAQTIVHYPERFGSLST